MSGEHGDGRARGELLPLMYSAAAMAAFAATKAVFDPDDLLNPGVIVRPRPLDADLRLPAPPLRRGLGVRLRRRHRRLLGRRAPLHRRRQVPRRHDRAPAASCARRTSRPATRRTAPAGARGCCRRWSTARWSPAAGARPRCASRSTSAWPARAARPTARPASTWRRTRPRCCTSRTGGGCGRSPTTASAGCRGGPGSRRRRRAWSTPRSVARAPGSGNALAGIDPRRDPPRFATRTFRRWFADHPSADRRSGAAVGGHVHRPLHTGRRHRRGRGARARRLLGTHPGRPLCCGLTWISTGQLDERPEDPAPERDRAGAVGGGRGPDRRAGAVLHGGVPRRRRRPVPRRARSRARRPRSRGPPVRSPSCSPSASVDLPDLSRCPRGGSAALPPPRGDGLVDRRDAAAAGRCDGRTRSAAAAAWPATSASSAGITTCRSRSPRRHCCRPYARPTTTRSCSPTGSPAVPSSISWPGGPASTWPNFSPPPVPLRAALTAPANLTRAALSPSSRPRRGRPVDTRTAPNRRAGCIRSARRTYRACVAAQRTALAGPSGKP